MKLAILGPSCFGLALARYARAQGAEVMVAGRSPLRPECFALGFPATRYLQLDVRDAHKFLWHWQPQVIVNFAAQGEGAASFDPATWRWFYDTNAAMLAELTGRLLDARWLERFIQIGSSEVYGSVTSPSKESDPVAPSSPYAASKLAFDCHLQAIYRTKGFPALIVRPSNGYGPGQHLHRVIPKAMLYGLMGRKLPLQGGGHARKSYLHMDDLSRAILLLAKKGTLGEIYNAGPLQSVSIRRVLELCAQCLGLGFADLVEAAPERTGQDGCYWLDSGKLRALGWSDQVALLGGLATVHEWAKTHLPALRLQPIDYTLRP